MKEDTTIAQLHTQNIRCCIELIFNLSCYPKKQKEEHANQYCNC